MRDWAGIDPGNESDPLRRDKDAKIDYFLRDLSRAMRRISDGEVPDGSGDLITNITLSDKYWVLLGRPGNQVGYGGTLANGTGTLSSTTDADKGFFYLGEAQQTAYDETNERLGINEPSPAAKLHITVGASDSILRPTATLNVGGMANELGNTTNLHNSVNDQSDATYVTCASAAAGGPTFQVASTTDPGTLTGFTITVKARSTDSDPTNKYINVSIQDNLNTTLFSASGINAARQLTANFTNYPLAVTFGSAPNSWTDLRVTIGWSVGGLPTDGNLQCSEIALTIPGTADTLQKWESGSNSNLLAYAGDTNGATTLEFSGTPKLRIATSGLEFDIGTPAAGNIWSASDSEGTGAWVTLGSLLDDDLEAIGALTMNRGDLIVGGASAWIDLAIGTAGNFLRSDGTDVGWSTTVWTNSATTGDLLYASAANTYSNLADVATGNALISGGIGVAPSWGKVGLTTHVSGILPLANGGTEANLTASVGGMVYSTAGALAILAGTATAGQIVRSGASAAPTWSTATYPATAGSSGNVLTSDGTNWTSAAPSGSTVDAIRSWTTLQTFPDNTFKIVGSASVNRTLVFEVDAASANADLILNWAGTADRTVTWPDATTTLAGLVIAQTFTKQNTFQADSDVCPLIAKDTAGHTANIFEAQDFAGGIVFSVGPTGDAIAAGGIYGTSLGVDLTGTPTLMSIQGTGSSAYTVTFPAGSSTVLMSTIAQTGCSGGKQFTGTIELRGLNSLIYGSTAASGTAWVNSTDTSKRLRMVLSDAIGNNSFTLNNTAARDYRFTDQSGAVATDANIVCYDNEVVCADDQVVLTY